MAYAVMQKTLDVLTVDTLKSAFRGVQGLTPLDAFNFAKEAFGIVVKGFELETATALQKNLAALGIDCEVVDQAALPQLPEIQFLARIEPRQDALMLYDQLGREAAVEWKDIAIIAAGRVMMIEFVEHKTPAISSDTYRPATGILDSILGSPTPFGAPFHAMDATIKMDSSMREERHERCMIEIIPAGAAVRYNVSADKRMPLLFQYLGSRRTDDLNQNFTTVVQDVLGGATTAAINRGAYYLRENSSTPFIYTSKQAFYSEITWLLWMMGQSSAQQQ